MPAPFEVELITPEETLYSGPSERLSVPGVAGSLGILANHAPLLTELKVGEASLIEPGGQERRFYIGGGFVEVDRNQVTILADDAIGEGDMDPVEAERLQTAAQEQLDRAGEGPEAATARRSLERAAARLEFVRSRR